VLKNRALAMRSIAGFFVVKHPTSGSPKVILDQQTPKGGCKVLL